MGINEEGSPVVEVVVYIIEKVMNILGKGVHYLVILGEVDPIAHVVLKSLDCSWEDLRSDGETVRLILLSEVGICEILLVVSSVIDIGVRPNRDELDVFGLEFGDCNMIVVLGKLRHSPVECCSTKATNMLDSSVM